MDKTAITKSRWDEDVDAGLIEYLEGLGYMYTTFDFGWSEEIFIGKDFETAFKTYSEING